MTSSSFQRLRSNLEFAECQCASSNLCRVSVPFSRSCLSFSFCSWCCSKASRSEAYMCHCMACVHVVCMFLCLVVLSLCLKKRKRIQERDARACASPHILHTRMHAQSQTHAHRRRMSDQWHTSSSEIGRGELPPRHPHRTQITCIWT